jgi:uncharacterized protein YaiE (UPF0345 family)
MASTVTFNTQSPFSLVGVVASADGVAGTALRAAVLAACAEGPLKTALSRVADWSAFNAGQSLCHAIHVREVVERSSTPEPASLEWFWTATGIKFNCTAAATFQFEIRLVGSERF